MDSERGSTGTDFPSALVTGRPGPRQPEGLRCGLHPLQSVRIEGIRCRPPKPKDLIGAESRT